jgi:cell division protein FtsW
MKSVTKKPDWGFIGLTVFFVLAGLVMIGDASLIEGQTLFNDQFYFIKRQLVWLLIGGSLAFLSANINYHFWKKVSKIGFLLSLSLLFLVFLPKVGITAYGAKRWLDFGFINIQPVELVKLSIIFLFSTLSTGEKEISLWHQLFFLSIPLGLVLIQPDFGSAALLAATAGSVWFLSGKKLTSLSFLATTGILIGFLLIISSPYRKNRLLGLLNPFYDPRGKSYHAYQLALTLGSGGLFGRGMGNSRQKFQYLPEVTTDSIVALIGEEFGFIGISVFITIFFLLIGRGIKIARQAPDKFGQVLAGGLISLIAWQGLINLGAVAIVLPLTGMPFPFVSYGGSSLITLLIAAGIIVSVSRQTPNK